LASLVEPANVATTFFVRIQNGVERNRHRVKLRKLQVLVDLRDLVRAVGIQFTSTKSCNAAAISGRVNMLAFIQWQLVQA